MGVEKLQGEPWHYEQRKRTCQDGSKYCLYILDNGCCGCKASLFYKSKCVGKGECDDFESKGNSCLKPGAQSNIKVVYHPERHKKKIKTSMKKEVQEVQEVQVKYENQPVKEIKTTSQKEDKKRDNFLRLSQERVNKILKDIEVLDNLSNKNAYHYTDEQVEKMFSYIEKSLAESKKHFKEKKSKGTFEW